MPRPAALRAAGLAGQASDAAYRVGAAIAAALAVTLFQSIFWADHVPWLLRLAIAGVAGVSVVSPPNGLLIVAGLSPLGYMLTSRVADAFPGRITEAIAVAFLAGAAVRGVVNWLAGHLAGARSEPYDRPPAQFLAPVVIFCGVAVASCVVHYTFVQAWHDRPGPFFERLVEFIVTGYHGDLGNYEPTASNAGFRFVFFTAFAVEGAALFLAAFLFCARDRGYLPRLVRMVAAGAVGAASLSFYALARAALHEAEPLAELPALLADRWTMFTPKLNTAASLFVLAGPLAIGAAAASGPGRRAGWVAGLVILVSALWINGTRVALLAAILVLAGTVAWLLRERLRWRALPRPATAGILVLSIGLAGTAFHRFYIDRDSALHSLAQRFMFSETSLRMFASAPVFGVGIDQYYLQSEQFASEAQRALYRRVPAHNPFLQTAAELGIIGLAPFTWMIGIAVWTCIAAVRRARHDPYLLGALAGVTAFLVTTLSSGHPLAIEVTAYSFWIVLGLAAGRASLLLSGAGNDKPAPRATCFDSRAIVAATLLIAASVPLRVSAQTRSIDFREVTYGLHQREDNGRYRYRWTSGHATLFVDGEAHGVELPLRAPLVARTGPMRVEILLDGQLANRIDLTTADWRRVHMMLPPSGQRYHTLELLVSPTWVPRELLPDSTDSRELGVMLGEIERPLEARAADAG